MKKLISALLALTMLFACLAGCGSSGSNNDTAPADGAATEGTAETEGTGSLVTEENSGAAVSTGSVEGIDYSGNIGGKNVVPSEHVGEVVYGISSDDTGFGPWTNYGDGGIAHNEVYEWLFDFEYFGGDLIGIIGKSYEQMDSNVYRVYMYDYVTDSEGNNITTEDVVFSYDKCREEGFYANRITELDHIEIVDDYTMDFVYVSEPVYSTLQESLMVNIVNKEYYESVGKDVFDLNPVGTGRYVMSDYVIGSYYTLTARKDYWQTDESALTWMQVQNCDTETYKVISDPAQMAIALESGEIDIAEIDASNIGYFYDLDAKQPKDGYYVEAFMSNISYVLVLNSSENSIMKNQDLRLGSLYALDNQVTVDLALDGQGVPEYTVGGSSYSGFQQAMIDEAAENCYAYDPDKSAEYLAAVGYNGEEIVLMCPAFLENLAQAVQGQLIAAGLNVTLKVLDPGQYEADCLDLTAFDMYVQLRGKSAGTLPAFWGHHIDGNHYSFGSASGILDEEMQALYEQCLSVDCTDADIMALHDYVAEHGYVYGIYNPMVYYVAREGVVAIGYTDFSKIEPGLCSFSADFE